jgi:L-amino acid N-acyltransferase YncA
MMAGTTAAPPEDLIIRDTTEPDMQAIQRIYAFYVLNGLATFEEIAPSVDDMINRRATVVAARLPYLTAELDGNIVGYAYASSYRPRPAYRHTIEDSVYVADGLGRRGIGGALLRTLISRCDAGPWRQMLAVIGSSENSASVALHARLGFRPVGTLTSVGFKLGQWVDTVLMQRALGAGNSSLP